MCGRYVLAEDSTSLKRSLERKTNSNITWINKEAYRPSYNIAPGQYQPLIRTNDNNEIIIQNMKWGLVPFGGKKPSVPSNIIINCRDDSLIGPGGGKSMYKSLKNSKRCIVIAEGFYEWLKKKGNKGSPYYIKRKDGELMLFAGLYEHVKEEELYTYTIITTRSSKQLSFLHDRMPVILNDEKSLADWLNVDREWSSALKKLIKPYEGELELYPVSQDVGKVKNNSPELIVPINSPQSKTNIANYFIKKKSKDDGKSGDGGNGTEISATTGDTDGKGSSSPSLELFETKTSYKRGFDDDDDDDNNNNDDDDKDSKYDELNEKKSSPSPKKTKI